MNNLVIFTWEPQPTGNNFNFKLQFNSISRTDPIAITKINETVAQSYNFPWISVSRKLSKVIVGSLDKTDNTKANYFGKSVDWMGKTTRDIVLTPAITSGINVFAISEDFLYIRNFETSTPKHFGYAIVGTTLVEAFN